MPRLRVHEAGSYRETMKPPPQAHGILAHYFTGPGYPPAQGALTMDEWEAGLDAYGARLIPSREWIDRALAGKQKDEVCVTFDDGLREAYVLALPSLERRGLTACFSIYTGPYVGVPNRMEDWRWLRNHGFPPGIEGFYRVARQLFDYGRAPTEYLAQKAYLTQEDRDFRFWRNRQEREDYESAMEVLLEAAPCKPPAEGYWMKAEEMRMLYARGHTFGFHTHSHPTDMTLLSVEAQHLEYATSWAVLANVLRTDLRLVRTMAHPCDTYTPEGLDWLRRNGVQIGWGGQVESTDLLRAPRWSTGYWAL